MRSGDHLGDGRNRAPDGNTVDELPGLARVIVDDDHGTVGAERICHHLEDQGGTEVSGTDNNDRLTGHGHESQLLEGSDELPDEDHERLGEEQSQKQPGDVLPGIPGLLPPSTAAPVKRMPATRP